jgi:hypothetical protein
MPPEGPAHAQAPSARPKLRALVEKLEIVTRNRSFAPYAVRTFW